jgi:hypothetical protein
MRSKTCFALAAGFCVAAMITAPAWAADGSDNLMQVTMRMTEHMSGMPAMPPRSIQTKVCTRAGQFDASALNRTKGQCKTTHYEKKGNVITFDQMCAGPQSITNHGVFHVGPGADFIGSMHTALNAAGHAVTVDTEYTGKRVGGCTYKPGKDS